MVAPVVTTLILSTLTNQHSQDSQFPSLNSLSRKTEETKSHTDVDETRKW